MKPKSSLASAILAIRDRVNDVYYQIERLNDEGPVVIQIETAGLREARDLLRVLTEITNGVSVCKAFGAPGDWGYGNELGQGVLQMLHETSESEAAAPALYEALAGMLAIEDSTTQGYERELRAKWIPLARAALAAAKGERT